MMISKWQSIIFFVHTHGTGMNQYIVAISAEQQVQFAGPASAVDEFQVADHDLGDVVALTAVILPAARRQPAINTDLAALL